jgi:ABC-type nitrate/sulfonate/bicarbonate transport system ATPase subunit
MNLLNNKLEIKNITKSYNNVEIIKDISLNLKQNETISLLGVSGIGKTTLFDIIAGLSEPDSGKVILNGADITKKPGKIGYMLQKDLLLSYKNIIDNVSLPLVIRGKKKKEAREYAMRYLEQFGLLGYENMYPNSLSGGMRQRAALLRTYLFNSEVLLLDEPFSALDIQTKAEMQKWFLDISNKIQLSTIFITHNLSEAIELSDRIFVMANIPGQIVKEFVIDKNNKDNKNLKDEISNYF